MLSSNLFTKGMNQDIHPKFQPEGTYRFALNSVLETKDGKLPSISNEIGNTICSIDYPTDKIIIGHTLTDTDDIVLFLFDPDPTRPEHEIGLYNPTNCTYNTKLIGACLNFSDKYPINALFRIVKGCERVVYFTDNYNPYRVFNLTFNEDIADPIEHTILPGGCERLLFSRNYKFPCINLYSGEGTPGITDAGGSLEIGTYSFAIRYLDKDFNATDWLYITRSMPIADEPYTYTNSGNTVAYYDGGSNNPESPFYVPKTNKSIRLNITNLDLDFYYYQIAAIKRTSDDGSISGIDILFPQIIPAGASDNNFYYTGLSTQVQREASIDEILSIKQRIEKAGAHAILDSRLYVGNIVNSLRDYSSYQKYASKIKTEWVRNYITSYNNSYVKQPGYYYSNASFPEDEVVAWGIVYIHEDGQQSPVFHIPGRAPDVVTGDNPWIGTGGVATDGNPWDTGEVVEGDYGNMFDFSSDARWQNVSTYTVTNISKTQGLCGYWETQTTYPVIDACTDDPDGYWGRDWQDNLIEAGVTKIRHHKTPSAEVRAGTDEGHRIGFKFSNVEYPDDSIVSHFFVYGDRTSEKTIANKGVLIPLPEFSETSGTIYYDDYNSIREIYSNSHDPGTALHKTYAYITNEQLFDNTYSSGLYFKHEKNLRVSQADPATDAQVVDLEPYNIDQYDTTVEMQTRIYQTKHYTQPTNQNYKINFAGWLPKATLGSQFGNSTHNPILDKSLVNNSINTNVLILTFEDELPEIEDTPGIYKASMDTVPYGSLRVNVDVFNNLFNINYIRSGNCKLAAPLSSLTSYTTYAGDVFMSRLNFVDFRYSQNELGDKSVGAAMLSFIIEDKNINAEFRHGSKTQAQYAYFQPSYQYNHHEFRSYLGSKYYEYTDDLMVIYPETYNYNRSYSFMEPIDRYYPLPINHRFCTECEDEYPYRIFYSEQGNLEESEDSLRIIRPNNYRDLEGNTGEITDLFVNFNELYATTPHSCYFIATNPQAIQTNGLDIYLGTGQILGIPPRQLKTSDNAFGGQEFFKSRISTEYGTLYVDNITGRPFLITNQLDDLSNNGLRNFWQENGKVKFLSQFFSLTGVNFPFKSTSSKVGVGYITTYDPRYKRLIIHKRDFKLLKKWQSDFVYYPQAFDDPNEYTVEGKIWFNNFKFYHNIGGVANEITFNRIDYFSNHSFTLSYSFITNSWVSFHSYLPNYIFNGHETFFSSKIDLENISNIYKHSIGDYQSYYGIKDYHIIDLIAIQNPQEIKYANNIYYNSETSLYDPLAEYEYVVDDTFDGLIAYNSYQTTGFNILNLKDESFESDYSTMESLVSKVDNKYRISELRDISISPSSPIWDSSWTSLQSNPYKYIDKVPNQNNIDTSKSLFELSRLRDNYLGIRLFFKPENNFKITTDVINTSFANRNR